MAQDTTPALVLYVGDGVQTRFDVPFDKGPFGEIKVAFVRRGLTDYTWGPDTYSVDGYLYAWNGGVYTKTLTVDTDTPLYDKEGVATGDTWTEGMYREPKNDIFTNAYVEWTGDAITSNDVICIIRITEKDQPYSYPNNQKHIERALDHLSRQIQELQNASENALHVDPSWNYTMDDERKMDPISWLQTIVRSKGLTLREVRIDNGYIEYTTDDPDSETKTWNVIAGVKTGNAGVVSHIRETKIWDEEDQVYIPFLEYSVDGGNSWKPAGQAASELESLYVKKAGDTMSGALKFDSGVGATQGGITGYTHGVAFFASDWDRESSSVNMLAWLSEDDGFVPYGGSLNLGASNGKWDTLYVTKINNGYDIAVPATNSADTLALKSEVDLAANSGDQLTAKGVWYAKTDSATTPPLSAAVEGRDYADFSQVDGNGDPIIVVYTYTSGDWTETARITPPASYNGYVTVTSKIWDIPEQTGQQGGQVLWSHNQKTFTPYPRIISTSGLAITNSTFSNGTLTNVITEMPANPVAKTVANKQYVDNAVAAMSAYLPDLFDTKWKDYTISKPGWKLSDGNWINKTDAETAYQHLVDDYNALVTSKQRLTVPDYTLFRNENLDEPSATHPYAFSSRDQTYVVYTDVLSGSVTAYDGPTAGATALATANWAGTHDMAFSNTETIAGTTITYYLADDGHKICLADQENNVNAIYTATGVAWYYILDDSNQRFKLPRTQHAFVGYRDAVGAYVPETLPNIKAGIPGVFFVNSSQTATGAATITNKNNNNLDNTSGDGECYAQININAHDYSSTYQDSAPVQQRATQMYLYFYVGV